MNEHSFTKAVMGKLPDCVHKQSMTMASTTHGGTPDRYIDYCRDLWLEVKFAKTKGTKGYDVGEMLSPLQKLWLRRRWIAGGNALVIVGVPLSTRALGFVLESPEEWEGRVSPDFFTPRLLPASGLASYILGRVS